MMNTKSLKLALSFLCLSALTTNVHAEGIYDGIYAIPNVGYVYIREQQGQVVAVLNQTVGDAYFWVAGQGALNGASARITSVLGNTRGEMDFVFTSLSTFKATQISCTAQAGRQCLVPNGTVFTGTKVW